MVYWFTVFVCLFGWLFDGALLIVLDTALDIRSVSFG